VYQTPLVLLASARPFGNTAAFVQQVFPTADCVLLDLLAAPLYPYSYTGHYPPDDAFAGLIEQVLQHEILVVATPVYWYAMSGLLKTFFDRLTDLVTIAKPLGRQLRGKRLLLLAVGSDDKLPAGFEEPFYLTANYFDMRFEGSLYYSQKTPPTVANLEAAIQGFRAKLITSLPTRH
jgi:hypothetical protein